MRVRALVFVAASLAVAHALSFLGSGPFDDDFICYRYARNWILGQGLVFNPGERFEGFTNPLWVMLLAAGMRLGLEPVDVSLSLSILASGVAAWAVGQAWCERYPAAVWPAPALLLAAVPGFAWHAVSGLGTTLLAALLALWFLAWERAARAGRVPWSAGVFLALACLLRQECALFALVFAAVELRYRGRLAVLLPLLTLVGWTVFRLVYYGRWFPIPYHVKQLPLIVDLEYGLRYLWQGTLECGVGLLVVLGLFAPRGPRDARRAVTTATSLAVLLHTVYVVGVGGDFVELSRFFVPSLPLMILLGCAGARTLVPSPRWRAGLVIAALVLVQWTQFGWTIHGRAFRRLDHESFEARWARLGKHFALAVAPGTRVAISPIGAFGYHSRLPLVDILGLTHDGLLEVAPDLDGVSMKGHHRHDARWVLAQRPQLVILGNGVRDLDGVLNINPWERDLYLDPEFQRDYQHMIVPIPGDADLDVHVLHGFTPPPGAWLGGER